MATDLVVGKPCSLLTLDLAGGEVRWLASWESPGVVTAQAWFLEPASTEASATCLATTFL